MTAGQGEVVDLERLEARLRVTQELLEDQGRALGRTALLWWEGPAADRYGELLDERRVALGRHAEEVGWLADTVAVLAVHARRVAGAGLVVGEAS